MRRTILASLMTLALAMTTAADELPRPFAIEIVDSDTGRGVPLVELTTVDGELFVTDSNGLIAITDPGLLGQEVFFHVKSHGYRVNPDGFGVRGRRIQLEPGGSLRFPIERVNVAERLYRVTGRGIYRDSVILGRPTPLKHPNGQAHIMGCDSITSIVYRGRVRWFWGDTSRASYPLGSFHMTSASSPLPADGGLPPEQGIEFDYITGNDGFVRPVCQMPGDGPTWAAGLAVIRDEAGEERLYATYSKIRNGLEAYDWGLVVWNDKAEKFDLVNRFERPAVGLPSQDHLVPVRDADRSEHLLIARPFPLIRVRATQKALGNPQQYESYTPLVRNPDGKSYRIQRDEHGQIEYAWRANTPALFQDQQAERIESGELRPEERLIAFQDADTGRRVIGHSGSIAWNEYRGCYVAIMLEKYGESSYLGNVWYAEAETPLGPWVYARQIVNHDKYSFYNPRHHPFFDQEGGRVIYFEGTYTHTFSGNERVTPRYDYNQLMYRLDLDDQRLNLPRGVYEVADNQVHRYELGRSEGRLSFFAKSQGHAGLVGFVDQPSDRGPRLRAAPLERTEVEDARFFAYPANADERPETTVPLYEFVHRESGRARYSTDESLGEDGYERSGPIGHVWRNPVSQARPNWRFND